MFQLFFLCFKTNLFNNIHFIRFVKSGFQLMKRGFGYVIPKFQDQNSLDNFKIRIGITFYFSHSMFIQEK